MKAFSLVMLAGLGAAASAQNAVPAAQDAGVDEVVVPGRTPENLRVEIERVEAAVYERFNALNSNDDFDIRCFDYTPTGSNIPSRTCAPNFAIRAQSRAAADILRDRQGSASAGNPVEHGMRLEQMSQELTAEMQRIAREDEQLLRDLTRLAELKQVQSNGKQPPVER